MRTRAEKIEGGRPLKGSRLRVAHAPIADLLTLAARTRPELTPDAISLVLVELPNPGIAIHRLKKEGIRGSDTGLLHIEDAFGPDDCLLGERTGTYPVALESQTENRLGIAANALGMAQGVFEAALAYARTRMVHGKGIGQFQATARKLEGMATRIEAARWLPAETEAHQAPQASGPMEPPPRPLTARRPA